MISGQAPDIRLRPATSEDLPFLREMIYAAAFAQDKDHPEPPPPQEEALQIPWLRDYVDSWGREGDYGLIAVDASGGNVGAAWYRRFQEDGGHRHVQPYELAMAVREGDRGRNVGESLLRALLEHAGEQGIGMIGLQVSERNEAARGLYKKLGFTVIGDRDEYGNYVMSGPTGSTGAQATGEPAPGSGSGLILPDDRHSVAGYYGAFAPLHDRYAESSEWPAKVDRFVGTAVSFKRGGPIRSVLDLGVGTGFSVRAILNHTRPDLIVGVDVSPEMVERLRERYGPSVVETVISSIEEFVPANREKFDLITSMTTLELVRGLPHVLEGIADSLNEDGLFAATYMPRVEGGEEILVTDSDYLRETMVRYTWPQEEIEESLTSGGLRIVHRDSSLPAYVVHGKWVNYNFVVASK